MKPQEVNEPETSIQLNATIAGDSDTCRKIAAQEQRHVQVHTMKRAATAKKKLNTRQTSAGAGEYLQLQPTQRHPHLNPT